MASIHVSSGKFNPKGKEVEFEAIDKKKLKLEKQKQYIINDENKAKVDVKKEQDINKTNINQNLSKNSEYNQKELDGEDDMII